MKQSIKERILLYIKAKKLSQKRFEEAVGISNGYVNNLKDSPSSKILQKIFDAFPDINKSWLLTGEGDMLLGDITNGDGSAQAVGHGSTATVGVDASQFIDVIKKQQEQIDRLLSILEKKK